MSLFNTKPLRNSVIAYAAGVLTMLSTPLVHRQPEVPDLLDRVNEINMELKGQVFENVTLEELGNMEGDIGITGFVANAVTYQRNLAKERAEIQNSPEYATQKAVYEEAQSSRNKNFHTQGYAGILLATAGLGGIILDTRRRNKKLSESSSEKGE